jgi:hypothetical protein
MECVDLLQQFGDRLRIGFDSAYSAKRRHKHNLDPWYMIIRCKTAAEIYPYGGQTLVVELEGHRHIRKRLDGLACCRVHQRGDDFASYLFDVADFKAVARVVKPYRRRQLTDAQRAELRARFQASVRQKGPGIASDQKDHPEVEQTGARYAGSEVPPKSPDSPSPNGDAQDSSDAERDRPAA